MLWKLRSQKSSHCVGTKRPAALSQKQIQHIVRSTDYNKLSNFEGRMVAEVKLYWLVYQMSSAPPISISRTDRLLDEWAEEHAALFGNLTFPPYQSINACTNPDGQINQGRNSFNSACISLIS